MKQTARALFSLRRLGFLALLALTGSSVAAEVKTNWVDRWVTNAVEVYVPVNRYVAEYHTNIVVRTQTNVVYVYSTNLLTVRRTNRVAIEVVRTNFVQAYHTNYRVLNLTNWSTVVVLKTNWIQQPVTNVAEVEMAQAAPAAADSAKPAPVVAATPASTTDAITIEATRSGKQAPKNQAEVLLNARWTKGGQSPVRVLQWKVQSEDGRIFCYGQEPEFRRNLPFGNYKVELKAQSNANAPATSVRGTLSVTAREVRLIEQRMLAKR